MTGHAREVLLRQFDLAWRLADYHLQGLDDETCLWRPAAAGPHVWRDATGRWSADWPEHERYDLGPPSVAWITWHMIFWWSMVLDHSFGSTTLRREDVTWPGSAATVRDRLQALASEWRSAVAALADEDLVASQRTRWPFHERPFADVVAWVNVELAKNAAEIGYARFCRAVMR